MVSCLHFTLGAKESSAMLDFGSVAVSDAHAAMKT